MRPNDKDTRNRVPLGVIEEAPSTEREETPTFWAPVEAEQRCTQQLHDSFGNQDMLAALSGTGGELGDLMQTAATVGLSGVSAESMIPGSAPLSVMRAILRAQSQADEEGLDTDRAAQRIGSRAGQALPEPVRAKMERVFGHDLSAVRIHTDGGAAEAAEALHATAFTTGADIYFGRGAWRPGQLDGIELLAHELTHVVQAIEGRLPSQSGGGLDVSSPNDRHELEAEAKGREVAQAWSAVGLEEGVVEGGVGGDVESVLDGPLEDVGGLEEGIQDSVELDEQVVPEAEVSGADGLAGGMVFRDDAKVYDSAQLASIMAGKYSEIFPAYMVAAVKVRHDANPKSGQLEDFFRNAKQNLMDGWMEIAKNAEGGKSWDSVLNTINMSPVGMEARKEELLSLYNEWAANPAHLRWKTHAQREKAKPISVARFIELVRKVEKANKDWSPDHVIQALRGLAGYTGKGKKRDKFDSMAAGTTWGIRPMRIFPGIGLTGTDLWELRSAMDHNEEESQLGHEPGVASDKSAIRGVAMGHVITGLSTALHHNKSFSPGTSPAQVLLTKSLDNRLAMTISGDIGQHIFNTPGAVFGGKYVQKGQGATEASFAELVGDVDGYLLSKFVEKNPKWKKSFKKNGGQKGTKLSDLLARYYHVGVAANLDGELSAAGRYKILLSDSTFVKNLSTQIQKFFINYVLAKKGQSDGSWEAFKLRFGTIPNVGEKGATLFFDWCTKQAAKKTKNASTKKSPTQGLGGNISAAPEDTHAIAQQGLSGPRSSFPHAQRIQPLFGHHRIDGVHAVVGAKAAEAANELGAQAYASGGKVAFAKQPDLFTAAHEAAHVIQQRAGLSLSGGVGKAGDAHERQADEVARAVVQGRSAAPILDKISGSARSSQAASKGVQRRINESKTSTTVLKPTRKNQTPVEDAIRYNDDKHTALLRQLIGALGVPASEAGDGTHYNAALIQRITRVQQEQFREATPTGKLDGKTREALDLHDVAGPVVGQTDGVANGVGSGPLGVSDPCEEDTTAASGIEYKNPPAVSDALVDVTPALPVGTTGSSTGTGSKTGGSLSSEPPILSGLADALDGPKNKATEKGSASTSKSKTPTNSVSKALLGATFKATAVDSANIIVFESLLDDALHGRGWFSVYWVLTRLTQAQLKHIAASYTSKAEPNGLAKLLRKTLSGADLVHALRKLRTAQALQDDGSYVQKADPAAVKKAEIDLGVALDNGVDDSEVVIALQDLNAGSLLALARRITGADTDAVAVSQFVAMLKSKGVNGDELARIGGMLGNATDPTGAKAKADLHDVAAQQLDDTLRKKIKVDLFKKNGVVPSGHEIDDAVRAFGNGPGWLEALEKAQAALAKKMNAKTKALFDAIDGAGDDEKAAYKALASCTPAEIEVLESLYRQHYGKDLRVLIGEEFDDSESTLALGLMETDPVKRAEGVKAVLLSFLGFWGDDEDSIEQVLLTLTSQERAALAADEAFLVKLKSNLNHCEASLVDALLLPGSKTISATDEDGKLVFMTTEDVVNKATYTAAKIHLLMHSMSNHTKRLNEVIKLLAALSKFEIECVKALYRKAYGKEMYLALSPGLAKAGTGREAGAGQQVVWALLRGDRLEADSHRILIKGEIAASLKRNAGKILALHAEFDKQYSEYYPASSGPAWTDRGHQCRPDDRLRSSVDTYLDGEYGLPIRADGSLNPKRAWLGVLANGESNDPMELVAALDGEGTDEATAKGVMERFSKLSPKQRVAFEKQFKSMALSANSDFDPSMKAWLEDDFTGVEEFEMLELYRGEAKTSQEKMDAQNRRHAFATKGALNGVGDGVTKMGESMGLHNKSSQLDRTTGLMRAQMDAVRAGKADGSKLDQLAAWGKGDANSYWKTRDAIADTVGEIAEVVAAIVVAIATEGAGSAWIVAVLMRSGAAALVGVLAKLVIKGNSYGGLEEGLADAGKVLLSALGGGFGAKCQNGISSFVDAVINSPGGRGTLKRMLAGGLTAFIENCPENLLSPALKMDMSHMSPSQIMSTIAEQFGSNSLGSWGAGTLSGVVKSGTPTNLKDGMVAGGKKGALGAVGGMLTDVGLYKDLGAGNYDKTMINATNSMVKGTVVGASKGGALGKRSADQIKRAQVTSARAQLMGGKQRATNIALDTYTPKMVGQLLGGDAWSKLTQTQSSGLWKRLSTKQRRAVLTSMDRQSRTKLVNSMGARDYANLVAEVVKGTSPRKIFAMLADGGIRSKGLTNSHRSLEAVLSRPVYTALCAESMHFDTVNKKVSAH